MDVVEAVSTAKKHILNLFEDEKISHLGLEEAFFDETRTFGILLSASRPWDNPQSALQALTQISTGLKRSYKVIEISEKYNKVLSVKNYTT